MPPRPTLPPASAWTALSVQMIAFPVQPQMKGEDEYWKSLTGSEPTDLKRSLVERRASGTHENRSLSVALDPARIIWTATPYVESPEEIDERMPSMGSFPSVRDWFVPLIGQWLTNHAPPIKRLAFACRLFQGCDTKQEGYKRLGEYLHPNVIVSLDSSDFRYQVNRMKQRKIGQDDVGINRLASWTPVIFKMKIITDMAPETHPTGWSPSADVGIMLNLDINTAAEYDQTLPSELLGDTLDYLSSLALEIAANGDEP